MLKVSVRHAAARSTASANASVSVSASVSAISVAHAVKSTLVTARNASIQRYAASTTVTHVRLDTNDIRLCKKHFIVS